MPRRPTAGVPTIEPGGSPRRACARVSVDPFATGRPCSQTSRVAHTPRPPDRPACPCKPDSLEQPFIPFFARFCAGL